MTIGESIRKEMVQKKIELKDCLNDSVIRLLIIPLIVKTKRVLEYIAKILNSVAE